MSRYFVAGSSGFLGSLLTRGLGADAHNRTIGHRYDFKHITQCFKAIQESGCRTIFNCAGRVGGIKFNRDNSAVASEDNILIGMNLMWSFYHLRLDKFIQVGSVCSYPRECPLPTSESSFWNGRPEETNAAYGLAKRTLVEYGQALSAQHKVNIIHPILANLYGPGDTFDGEDNHVIAAMIKRFVEAAESGTKVVTLWGSGDCSREFLYVGDAVDALIFLNAKYDEPGIINVSSGQEIKIKHLAEKIAKLAGYSGDIRWDKSKPDGQPRRHFDTSKLEKLGWSADISFNDGLKMTISDYKKRRIKA